MLNYEILEKLTRTIGVSGEEDDVRSVILSEIEPYADEIHRSWIFRSVGYGNDASYWKDIISNLRMVGYDYAISIEHEDSLMSQNEGLTKAVEMLKEVLITESTGDMWWV